MDTLKAGSAVAVVGRDGPEAITKIAKVRVRLGKVTGYETTDKRTWTRTGHETGAYPRLHIEPATGAHGDAVRRRRLVSSLAAVDRETWAKLPIDVLRATWAVVEAVRKEAP